MQSLNPSASSGASVTCLQDYARKRRVTREGDNYVLCIETGCDKWHPVSRPQGARAGDTFVTSEILIPEPFESIGIREGDFLIFLVTNEVEQGDLVAAFRGSNVYMGFLHRAATGGICFLSTEYDLLYGSFKPSQLDIIGRAVEVQRHFKPVNLVRALRPVHPSFPQEVA